MIAILKVGLSLTLSLSLVALLCVSSSPARAGGRTNPTQAYLLSLPGAVQRPDDHITIGEARRYQQLPTGSAFSNGYGINITKVLHRDRSMLNWPRDQKLQT
jgi:hypothetical protein